LQQILGQSAVANQANQIAQQAPPVVVDPP